MTSIKRNVLCIAIVVGLMMGLGCGPTSSSLPLAPPIEDFPPDGLADYLPADALGVLTLNWRQVLESPVGASKLREPLLRLAHKEGGRFWLHLLGIDPLADVDGLQLIYRRGALGQPLILVKGRFDASRFRIGPGELQEVRVGPDDCFRLYQIPDEDEKEMTSLALADNYLVACEARGPVVDALNHALMPGKGPVVDEDLRQALARVNRKQGLWLSVPLARLGPVPRLSNKGLELILRPIFRLARNIEGGLNFDHDVRGEIRFATASEEDASQLETALRSTCELAQTAPALLGRDRDLGPIFALLATGTTSREGTKVTFRCQWVPE